MGHFASLWLSAVQDLDEGFSKLNVEGSVDDGVDGAVEVSQPGDGTVQWGGNTAAPAVGLQHVGQEERQPADDEYTLETEQEDLGPVAPCGCGKKILPTSAFVMKQYMGEKARQIFNKPAVLQQPSHESQNTNEKTQTMEAIKTWAVKKVSPHVNSRLNVISM